MVTLINAAAWILCIVMGVLLLGDFIRTEINFKNENKKNEAGKEAKEDGRNE